MIPASLSFKKQSCKTLRLCHLEPNQHAYTRRELLHDKISHGYAKDCKHFIWCEYAASNRAQGGQHFCIRGACQGLNTRLSSESTV